MALVNVFLIVNYIQTSGPRLSVALPVLLLSIAVQTVLAVPSVRWARTGMPPLSAVRWCFWAETVGISVFIVTLLAAKQVLVCYDHPDGCGIFGEGWVPAWFGALEGIFMAIMPVVRPCSRVAPLHPRRTVRQSRSPVCATALHCAGSTGVAAAVPVKPVEGCGGLLPRIAARHAGVRRHGHFARTPGVPALLCVRMQRPVAFSGNQCPGPPVTMLFAPVACLWCRLFVGMCAVAAAQTRILGALHRGATQEAQLRLQNEVRHPQFGARGSLWWCWPTPTLLAHTSTGRMPLYCRRQSLQKVLESRDRAQTRARDHKREREALITKQKAQQKLMGFVCHELRAPLHALKVRRPACCVRLCVLAPGCPVRASHTYTCTAPVAQGIIASIDPAALSENVRGDLEFMDVSASQMSLIINDVLDLVTVSGAAAAHARRGWQWLTTAPLALPTTGTSGPPDVHHACVV